MNRTKIPWCDWTWNPVVGCSPASTGCANCYAAAISRRFGLPWGQAHFMPDRLEQPARVRKSGRVFVCSMSDLGHETVRPEWRGAIYGAMAAAPWHTYIILTKRPAMWLSGLPRGAWIGVTIEDSVARHRLDELNYFAPAGCVRFVSVEPMLGRISFAKWKMRPQWVIAGPETGPARRACPDEWLDELAAESPCFFDKRGGPGRRREFPGGAGTEGTEGNAERSGLSAGAGGSE